ncbi:hypothetical protein SLEP1_g6096 [Rubroshorea leprosula]|uniref:Uncharacterized protein n=1 Tax=Rubroshorea leprosula TaxID=152421 RepID=A0AAV5HUE2_9ROSI|nr:hypothetical protein SLEP1_g6096 [Rubroshorea leprosula]
MAERKLNFNAPLISVRRFSATTSFSKGEKGNKTASSVLDRRYSLPNCKSDVSLDQVTEPVTVPFMWEHIPGKAKDGVEPASKHSEGVSVTPRIPPGRALDVIKYPLEKEFENQNLVSYPIESCSSNDNVAKLEASKEATDKKWGFETDNDDDVYSDALDTLSATDSLSLNCSISGLSESGDPVVEPSGTFSTDPQTRDFMMSRFLPAAKAMALKPSHYASKKQPPPVEQPREAMQVVSVDRKTPVNLYESITIPHYDQGLEEEETESEDYDYNSSGSVSRKGCGLFPRLCFKNSLCLLNPVPGFKVRTHSSMSSLSQVGKASKAAYMESHSQTVKKHAWDAAYKKKLDSGAQSPKLSMIGNKLTSVSSLTNSSHKHKKLDSGAPSPQRSMIGNKLASASSLTKSSHKHQKLDSGASSPKRSMIGNKLTSGSSLTNPSHQQQKSESGAQCPKLPKTGGSKVTSASSQFTNSTDQQISRSSSPYTGRISPYRRERPPSPFRGGGFLGIPKGVENFKANMMNKHDRISNEQQELSSHQSFKQGSESASPAVEKTLYVDTENFVELPSFRSNSSGIRGQMEYTGKSSEASLGSRVLEETATSVSSLEDIKCLTISEEIKISKHNRGPTDNRRSSFSDMPNFGRQVKMIRCFNQDGGLDQESKSLECIKVGMYENLNFSSDNGLKADDQGVCTPPLPKTPSESWLGRTLPSVGLQNPFKRTYTGTQFHPKKEEPKAASTNDKWETIVKTSHLHHDHVRYSEELVTHVYQQPRT